MEKCNVKNLLKNYTTTLIWAAKLVNKKVFEIKALKHFLG